jgi:HEAT repeat protein
MEGLVPLLAAGCAAAAGAWVSLTAATVAGRLAYDRRRIDDAARHGSGRRLSARRAERLVARASHHRSEHGKWRRIAALRTLVRARHPRRQELLKAALWDRDRDVVGVAVKLLGEIDTIWAGRLLVAALRENRYPRARVAAQLERRAPAIGPRLEPLLRRSDANLRFWAVTLLAGCPEAGGQRLLALTHDPDANVRAAAIETLAERRHHGALAAARSLLTDDVWFVRVHALRALGRLGDTTDATVVARHLGDPRWWARAAAKDALRGFGLAAAGSVIPFLDHLDPFVRNGAAEVLQDIGFVDAMATTGRQGILLERILEAGGPAMRAAAEERARRRATAGAALLERSA